MSSTLQMIRGDTSKFKFQSLDATGEVITTTPDAIYFTVKETTKNLNPIFQKTKEDMTMESDGTWHFVVEPTDTNSLQYWEYVYDLEVIQSGVKTTISIGKFIISPEVTWAANEGE